MTLALWLRKLEHVIPRARPSGDGVPQSAIDELAIAADRDALDLRRELLAENPRTLRALELAAERGG